MLTVTGGDWAVMNSEVQYGCFDSHECRLPLVLKNMADVLANWLVNHEDPFAWSLLLTLEFVPLTWVSTGSAKAFGASFFLLFAGNMLEAWREALKTTSTGVQDEINHKNRSNFLRKNPHVCGIAVVIFLLLYISVCLTCSGGLLPSIGYPFFVIFAGLCYPKAKRLFPGSKELFMGLSSILATILFPLAITKGFSEIPTYLALNCSWILSLICRIAASDMMFNCFDKKGDEEAEITSVPVCFGIPTARRTAAGLYCLAAVFSFFSNVSSHLIPCTYLLMGWIVITMGPMEWLHVLPTFFLLPTLSVLRPQ